MVVFLHCASPHTACSWFMTPASKRVSKEHVRGGGVILAEGLWHTCWHLHMPSSSPPDCGQQRACGCCLPCTSLLVCRTCCDVQHGRASRQHCLARLAPPATTSWCPAATAPHSPSLNVPLRDASLHALFSGTATPVLLLLVVVEAPALRERESLVYHWMYWTHLRCSPGGTQVST